MNEFSIIWDDIQTKPKNFYTVRNQVPLSKSTQVTYEYSVNYILLHLEFVQMTPTKYKKAVQLERQLMAESSFSSAQDQEAIHTRRQQSQTHDALGTQEKNMFPEHRWRCDIQKAPSMMSAPPVTWHESKNSWMWDRNTVLVKSCRNTEVSVAIEAVRVSSFSGYPRSPKLNYTHLNMN